MSKTRKSFGKGINIFEEPDMDEDIASTQSFEESKRIEIQKALGFPVQVKQVKGRLQVSIDLDSIVSLDRLAFSLKDYFKHRSMKDS